MKKSVFFCLAMILLSVGGNAVSADDFSEDTPQLIEIDSFHGRSHDFNPETNREIAMNGFLISIPSNWVLAEYEAEEADTERMVYDFEETGSDGSMLILSMSTEGEEPDITASLEEFLKRMDSLFVGRDESYSPEWFDSFIYDAGELWGVEYCCYRKYESDYFNQLLVQAAVLDPETKHILFFRTYMPSVSGYCYLDDVEAVISSVCRDPDSSTF